MIRLSEATVNPPLNAQVGDTLERSGSTINLRRNGQIVATAALGQPEPIESGEIVSNRLISSVFIAEEKPMPAISATITSVSVNPTTGVILVNFSNGSQREFADWSALSAHASSQDTSATHAEDLALMVLGRRGDPSNLDICNGMGVTIDGAASEPVSFSGMPVSL